jgi:hypothetical protein
MNPCAQEWRFERYPASSGTRHLVRVALGAIQTRDRAWSLDKRETGTFTVNM